MLGKKGGKRLEKVRRFRGRERFGRGKKDNREIDGRNPEEFGERVRRQRGGDFDEKRSFPDRFGVFEAIVFDERGVAECLIKNRLRKARIGRKISCQRGKGGIGGGDEGDREGG